MCQDFGVPLEDLEFMTQAASGDLQALKESQIFLTGCTGFLGKWIIEELLYASSALQLGLALSVLTRSVEKTYESMPHWKKHKNLRLLEGDICTWNSGGVQDVTHIIHGANYTNSGEKDWALQHMTTAYEGTLRMLEMAREHHSQSLLLLSSGAVYGLGHAATTAPFVEQENGADDYLQEPHVYALCKYFEETYTAAYGKKYGIRIPIARLFTFMGKYMPLHQRQALSSFINDVQNDRNIVIQGDGTSVRSYMYAADMVVWLLALLVRGEHGTPYNVGSDEPISIRDLATKVAKASGNGREIRILGKVLEGNASARYVPSVNRVSQLFGLSVKSIDCRFVDCMKRVEEMNSKKMMKANHKNPKVSVCMTSYNHEKYVGEAIESVLSQSFIDFEFLILEHASTDNSLNVIRDFKDERIRLEILETNKHSTYAANLLVPQSRGEYVALICSDDVWHPEKLAEQVKFLDENKSIAAVFTRVSVVGDNGQSYDFDTPYDFYFNSENNRSRFDWLRFMFDFKFNPFCCSSVLIRKNVLESVGYFDIRSRNMQDFILWQQVLTNYDVFILDGKLTVMRYFDKQTNVTGNNLRHNIIVCNEAVIAHENFFSSVADVNTLLKIFPDIFTQYEKLYQEDIIFYLALLGAKAKRADLVSYSINALYKMMADAKKRSILNERYNFSHLSLYKISEQSDVYGYEILSRPIGPMTYKVLTKIKSVLCIFHIFSFTRRCCGYLFR